MSFKKILPLILLSTVLLFSKNMAGINANSEDFEIEAAVDINAFSEYTNGTIFIVDTNYLNTEHSSLFGLGLSAYNSLMQMEGMSLGLGVKYVYIEDFMALPLAIEASYTLPLMDSIPSVSLSASFLYAPSALAFDEAEDYLEFRAEAGMEVINSVFVYVGYRDIEIEYAGDYVERLYFSETYNSSFYAGLKIGF